MRRRVGVGAGPCWRAMSLGRCEFFVDDERVELDIPPAWASAALPERTELVRAFMAQRQLPAYLEARLLEAVALLEPEPEAERHLQAGAEAGGAGWAALAERGGADGGVDEEDDGFDAAFERIVDAELASDGGGAGWRQLRELELTYAGALEELLTEHTEALHELQEQQHEQMAATLSDPALAAPTAIARRRAAAATEALVHAHVQELEQQRAEAEDERIELQAAQRANYRSLAVSIADDLDAETQEPAEEPEAEPEAGADSSAEGGRGGGWLSGGWLSSGAKSMGSALASIVSPPSSPSKAGHPEDQADDDPPQPAPSPGSSADSTDLITSATMGPSFGPVSPSRSSQSSAQPADASRASSEFSGRESDDKNEAKAEAEAGPGDAGAAQDVQLVVVEDSLAAIL